MDRNESRKLIWIEMRVGNFMHYIIYIAITIHDLPSGNLT
jgi:hypothetical protein